MVCGVWSMVYPCIEYGVCSAVPFFRYATHVDTLPCSMEYIHTQKLRGVYLQVVVWSLYTSFSKWQYITFSSEKKHVYILFFRPKY